MADQKSSFPFTSHISDTRPLLWCVYNGLAVVTSTYYPIAASTGTFGQDMTGVVNGTLATAAAHYAGTAGAFHAGSVEQIVIANSDLSATTPATINMQITDGSGNNPVVIYSFSGSQPLTKFNTPIFIPENVGLGFRLTVAVTAPATYTLLIGYRIFGRKSI